MQPVACYTLFRSALNIYLFDGDTDDILMYNKPYGTNFLAKWRDCLQFSVCFYFYFTGTPNVISSDSSVVLNVYTCVLVHFLFNDILVLVLGISHTPSNIINDSFG